MKLEKFKKTLTVACAAVTLSSLHHAAAANLPTLSIFDLTVNVGGSYSPTLDVIQGGISSPSLNARTVSDLFDLSKSQNLHLINSSYTDSSAATIRFGYRGLPILLLAEENSSKITLHIPSLNEKVVFDTQATRDGNVESLKDYLKKSGAGIVNRFQRELVRSSPYDPIAGNPASLQSQMVNSDFDRVFSSEASTVVNPGSGGGNLLGLGVGWGSYKTDGVKTQSITLPISYTFRNDLDPRRQLTIYAPVTISEVKGARAYNLNTGVSYRFPLSDSWSLTPAIGYGIGGSVDLGSGSAMLGASLTSVYTWRLTGYEISMANMAGVYRSQKFTVNGYESDPKIRNVALRNGVLVSIPTQLFGRNLATEVSYIYTRYSGTEIYSKQYHELGLTLGTNKRASAARSALRAGISLFRGGHDIKGLRLNVGYWF